jgi:L-threonylcarbamoyladenylate synthase
MTRVPFTSPVQVAQSAGQIVEHLRAGGLIAYPTETVYGFGSLVRDDAVTALAALKARDPTKPFLLLIREATDIPELQWTVSARILAERFWPGPLTLVLRVREGFRSRILSSEGTVAVRATAHESVRALLEVLREPITSSSANLPGAPPATNADEAAAVLDELGRPDVLVLDGGQLAASLSSTLVDCSNEPPRLLRAGAITLDALTQVTEVIND